MDKKEYRYANLLFTGTIFFLVMIACFNISRLLSKLYGSSDYVFNICFSMTEFMVPLIFYLYYTRKKIVAYPLKTVFQEIRERLGLKFPGFVNLGLSLISGLAILPVLYFVNALSMLTVKDVTTEKVSAAAENYHFIVLFITVAVLPPLVEECIYRGVYLGVYKRAGIKKGVLLSAFLFGIMHSNLNQFAYAFTAGVIFALFAAATGSIICTLIMHIMVNASSVIRIYHPEYKYPSWMNAEVGSLSAVIKALAVPALIGLIITAACLYFMFKRSGINEKKEVADKKVADGMLILGIVIMVVNMIAAEFN